ncbi:hypothetical protein [Pantoea phage LIMEzero]|uniref:Nucleotidyltransferase n=1 Tax=Pantoea phage LIMEzero TaxID=943335 RepID=F4N9S5_9CAUD|nr:nucleotidyltransferase [Pantoea phage LIMEzero]CBY88553.1 hypothetical protein [Pantoea phage LIMEzero]
MLAAEGYDFVVAGGFARDTAAGVPPKDADICVYGGTLRNAFMANLPDYMFDWAESNGLPYSKAYSYGTGASDFDVRIDGVVKLGQVDIIFYHEARCWQEIVDKFDFNINQFYFPSSIPVRDYGTHGRGEPQLVGYAPVFTRESVAYGGNHTRLLVNGLCAVREDFCAAREQYILDKFSRIWPGIKDWLTAVLEERDAGTSH